MMAEGTKESCQCDACRALCRHKPGWFLPGQIEPLAAAMGITVKDLFDRYLAVDWWEENDRLPLTFLLSPAVKGNPTGEEFPYDATGTCVFYGDDGRCAVHDLGKPHECALALHDEEPCDRHLETARAWADHQGAVRDLVGREPVASGFGDILSLLFR
jgi:hypothetical protein